MVAVLPLDSEKMTVTDRAMARPAAIMKERRICVAHCQRTGPPPMGQKDRMGVAYTRTGDACIAGGRLGCIGTLGLPEECHGVVTQVLVLMSREDGEEGG